MRDSGAPAGATRWQFLSDCDMHDREPLTPSCVQFTIVHECWHQRLHPSWNTAGLSEPPRLIAKLKEH
jgi:hypothetical protein